MNKVTEALGKVQAHLSNADVLTIAPGAARGVREMATYAQRQGEQYSRPTTWDTRPGLTNEQRRQRGEVERIAMSLTHHGTMGELLAIAKETVTEVAPAADATWREELIGNFVYMHAYATAASKWTGRL